MRKRSQAHKWHENKKFAVFYPLLIFVGAAKDTPIVTPLMDFIRQKRAAKSGTRVAITLLTFIDVFYTLYEEGF